MMQRAEAGAAGVRLHQIVSIFRGNFSLTLTRWSHLLREPFDLERCCSHMRQPGKTKREQRARTLNEKLRKVLCSWA